MSGKLKALKEVAALDAQILELEAKKKQIPEQLRQKETEVEQGRHRLAAIAVELKGLRANTELKEKDYQAAEQAVIKLREQIGQAKSNKEFQALQHEILSKEADNTHLEDAVLQQMQKVDRQVEQRDAIAKDVKKLENALTDERAELETDLRDMTTEVDKLRKQRTEAGKGVPPEIFSKYERLIERRRQAAMVAVVDGTCQGCFMNLRPETMAQLKKGNDLVFCHSCARILYLED